MGRWTEEERSLTKHKKEDSGGEITYRVNIGSRTGDKSLEGGEGTRDHGQPEGSQGTRDHWLLTGRRKEDDNDLRKEDRGRDIIEKALQRGKVTRDHQQNIYGKEDRGEKITDNILCCYPKFTSNLFGCQLT